MENSEKYIVEKESDTKVSSADPPIVDEWSKIEDIRNLPGENNFFSIDSYIKKDMEQYPDDKQLDDFLKSIPSTIEGKDLMPSCNSLTSYIGNIIYDYQLELNDYDLAIEQIQRDKEVFYNSLVERYIEKYNKEYIPKYRRELRAWYARNKKQHLFNLHEEGENINESISK